jgi:hypothetical protein
LILRVTKAPLGARRFGAAASQAGIFLSLSTEPAFAATTAEK